MAIPAETRTPQNDLLLSVLELSSRHVASLEGRRVRALADRFDLLLREDPFGSRYHEMAVRSLAAEVAAAGHVSSAMAEGMLHRSHIIAREYPRVLAALEEGRVTLRHAEVIANAGAVLVDASEADRAEYAERALEIALAESAGRTEFQAKMLAADIAAFDVAERHRRAKAFHRVRVYTDSDGLGVLEVTGPEVLVRAAFDRATEMSKAIIADREPGAEDERTLDQVRTDVVIALLVAGGAEHMIGTPAEAIRASVQVTIAATTLTGADDRMGQIDGAGPVLPEIVRGLAAEQPVWSRLFLDAKGMTTSADSYSPTETMKRFLRARDQHCRFPGCVRAARRCQIDHNLDYAKGGKTETENLSCFCVKHHSLKHPDVQDRHRWRVRHLPGGVIEWTSPAGRVHVDHPTPRVAFV
ncbi:HNH endonuclease signature motif containing protein [Microbacterium tumbae]